MRFDGDIIITDPCYIMNHDNDNNEPYPWWPQYITRAKKYIKDGQEYFDMPKHEDYPDARKKTRADYNRKYNNDKKSVNLHIRLDQMFGKIPVFSETLQSEWEAYHSAAAAYQNKDHSDWERCGGGYEMEELGFDNYLSRSTLYGDWSCTVFNSDNKEVIGKFCADAGMVAVFNLDDVLKYNPNYRDHITSPHAVTMIKDFHGDIEIIVDDEENVRVRGIGNINFISSQTGF